MDSIIHNGGGSLPRSQLNQEIRTGLRDVSVQLSLLTHRIGGHLDLKDTDLQCLDLIDTKGPLSPSTLAKLAGLHPATMTGVIDRLERAGWITRERDPGDRRGVLLRAQSSRRADVLRLASGMNAELAKICADYPDRDLQTIARFLRQTATAGRTAIAQLDAAD